MLSAGGAGAADICQQGRRTPEEPEIIKKRKQRGPSENEWVVLGPVPDIIDISDCATAARVLCGHSSVGRQELPFGQCGVHALCRNGL